MEDKDVANLHGQLLALKFIVGALVKTHPNEELVREMIDRAMPDVLLAIEETAIREFGEGFNLCFTNVMD
ncbi:MAG: hypothetical protein REI95_07805 [Oxalicibacterium faecigallinarum]|uniref:hypothetical protein n=1 Tax=Oxalicibacterium faecigallinarum TaxID=573741 RepID=UPI002806BCF1|nr:hypothetical protein [Oxalicibacterium faecigallinarum]MDQ7969534.1 hypothetical protein [Oxalicibacterium faecigallinarum]